VATTWDIQRYCAKLTFAQTGQNIAQEELQENRFPPIFMKPFPVVSDPAVVTDRDGNTLVWYLPGIISPRLQVFFRAYTEPGIDTDTHGQHKLWANIGMLTKTISINPKSANWRAGPKYYRPSVSVSKKPGTVSMSPGWYEQGHQVNMIVFAL
jgi:hypothetical protein